MQWGEFNVPKLVEKHLENRIELSRQRNLETAEEQAKADLREFHKGSARTHPPLHWAAQYGLFDRISELLYAFEPVNEKSADGSTALHHAVHWSGSFGITKLLLEHGADPNEQRSKDGFAPLHELVSTSYKKDNDALQFVNKLVAHGADIHLEGFERRSVLGLAACQNLAGCVHRLIELGAHADSPFIMYSATGEFAPGGLRSALGIAAWHAHVETMKVLIEAGADVNYNGLGRTPLLEIVCNRGASKDPNRYVEGARLLLDAGADQISTLHRGVAATRP
jgi:ankyrin repeat protein